MRRRFELIAGHSPFLPYDGAPQTEVEESILGAQLKLDSAGMPAMSPHCAAFIRVRIGSD